MSQGKQRGPKPGQGRLAKSATGIAGLDEITNGGLPTGRTTLVLGGPGSGKTILGLDFLRHGFGIGEAGVFVTLEQGRRQIVEDAGSVGVDIPAAEEAGHLAVLSVDLTQQEFEEAGVYTLDGLLVAIERAAAEVDAKRIVIDQLDGFFDSFENARVLRKEFLRIATRFAERGFTTLLIGSAPGGIHRMEEFLSDCVLKLDHRVQNQVGTRRLRVLKYRGTSHGTDEYPFSITSDGMRVFPISSATLDYEVSEEIHSSGIDGLDAMLGGGYFQGSSVLVAGQAGTGKTTMACRFAAAAVAAGQRGLYFSFEESPQQLFRNARSVGTDLRSAVETGRLQFLSSRPTVMGLEQHLADLQDRAFDDDVQFVVIDPITNLISVGSDLQVKAMLTRLIDLLRQRHITVLLTSLIMSGDASLGADIAISSLMDAIVLLENRSTGRRRRRLVSIVKSRGLASSQDICEMSFSSDGIEVVPPAEPGDQGEGR